MRSKQLNIYVLFSFIADFFFSSMVCLAGNPICHPLSFSVCSSIIVKRPMCGYYGYCFVFFSGLCCVLCVVYQNRMWAENYIDKISILFHVIEITPIIKEEEKKKEMKLCVRTRIFSISRFEVFRRICCFYFFSVDFPLFWFAAHH